jgi:hypothetical protein
MTTYIRQMQRIVDDYRLSREQWPTSAAAAHLERQGSLLDPGTTLPALRFTSGGAI